MVSLWGLYSADRPKAERDFQAAVADLKVQIYAYVQENSKTASLFAPIRRLPVEVLGWWQQPFHAEIGAHKSVLAGGYLLYAWHMPDPSAFVEDQG